MELEYEADLSIPEIGKLCVRPLKEICACKEDLTRGRSVEGPKYIEEGALPHTGGAHNGDHLPLIDGDIYPPEDLKFLAVDVETLMEVLSAQKFFHDMLMISMVPFPCLPLPV